MPSGVECTLLTCLKELEAFAPAWRDLWQQDESCTPFQSPEWLVPWWRCFGNDSLRAISIAQSGRLIGFLPFYILCEERNTTRRLLPLGVGTTDYLDGVFAPACDGGHIRAALKMLLAEDDWDLLDVSQLRLQSKLLDAVKDFTDEGAVFNTEACSQMDAVRIADLPKKIRRNTLYYRNRATRSGALELKLAGPTTCKEYFDVLVRMHTERWEARGGLGVLADTRVLAWHQEALPLLERSGMLRFYAIRLDEEVIGAIYSLVDPPERPRRTQYFYLTAYATKHAELRPGTISLAMAIEHAFKSGVETIDMLRGDEEYKRLWHLTRRPTYGFSLDRGAMERVSLTAAEMAA